MIVPVAPCCSDCLSSCTCAQVQIHKERGCALIAVCTAVFDTTFIWPLSGHLWEPSERRQTAYRWIHSFQGLLYLAQMFDCHSACLYNLASHLKGSSRNANKTNIHHICQWSMSYSHHRQPLPPLMFVYTQINLIWKNRKDTDLSGEAVSTLQTSHCAFYTENTAVLQQFVYPYFYLASKQVLLYQCSHGFLNEFDGQYFVRTWSHH